MANQLKDKISEHNAKAYLDVAKDMLIQRKGIFTFTLKIDGKKVVDYVHWESYNYGETRQD